MPKLWKLKSQIPDDINSKLSEHPKLLRQLLYDRGLLEKEDIDNFLDTKYGELLSPFLFVDMQKAVERIWLAIEKKEKICIYGDYDADAVTANAVLQQTFRHLGTSVDSYIPDRFTEGYGINLEALGKIKERGAKIIITVDCGTNSTEAADWCSENGIDFIITDHHEIIGELPKAFAIINPKNPADKYPYDQLVGVGVAFKLACGILANKEKVISRLNLSPDSSPRIGEGGSIMYVDGWEKWLLDLVAIGTVADCHSLIGENRILVKFGLKVLQKTKWAGLKALIQSAGLFAEDAHLQQKGIFKKEPDTYTLGFVLAPRINAAGRLEHADKALNLLMAEDLASAEVLAQEVEEINKRRQDQTLRIVSEAKEQALTLLDRKILVLGSEGWSKGIVGLVAGKLVEEFGKPVIVLEKGELESTGSARTVGEFDVVESLKFASEYLVRFGGHKQAAGLTLKTEHFELFYSKVLEYADKNLEENQEPVLYLDSELDTVQLSIVNCQLLQRLEPFGVGNPKPKFLIRNMEVSTTRLVGQEGNHLQLKFKVGSKQVDGILFNAGHFAKEIKIGDTVDVAAELTEDTWNGNTKLKLRIIDLRNSN